jgi:hypothetical protein
MNQTYPFESLVGEKGSHRVDSNLINQQQLLLVIDYIRVRKHRMMSEAQPHQIYC